MAPSFYGVRDAEGWIRRQADLYRKTLDPYSRERLLTRALQALCREPGLSAICRDLALDRPHLDYAYRHNLGFYVIYLTDPEIGFQCRLHVWMPDAPPVIEKPHRHRMGFASKVLAGELRSLHYHCFGVDAAGTPTEGDERHHETWINAPAEGSFDNDSTELRVRRDVVLRVCEDRSYRAGDSYFFSAEGIHRVHSVEGRGGPTVTLTVWEPPFQSSLAYEPIGSLGRATSVRRPVVRISEARYLELLAAVQGALGRTRTEAVGV